MRRKSKNEILKENIWAIVLAICLLISGLFVIILPHILPNPTYEALQTKEVTVSMVEWNSRVRYGASYHYILTTDGEMYILSGDYQASQVYDLLKEGTTVTIKWYQNKPFSTQLIEELIVNGQRIVTYNNNRPVEWQGPLIVGLCVIAMGVGDLLLARFYVKHNIEIQKKRDERIIKKYGNLKKHSK